MKVRSILELDGLSVSQVNDAIESAKVQKKLDVKAYSKCITHQELPVITMGTEVIYLRDNKPFRGVVVGFTVTVIMEDEKITHSRPVSDMYYIKYPNGCSSSVPAESVFLTIEEAKEAIFKDVV